MSDLHPILEDLIEKRGIADRDAFLNPNYEMRHDPFLMKGMLVAVDRLLQAIKNDEQVAVWSDYDCDGVPGGALMRHFFSKIEYPLRSYIPERSEGYGMNKLGIQKLKDEGVSLIVTVDCGITNVEEVAFAKGLGIDVIVSDHHLPQEHVPEALAVLNPHQNDCAYPFKELCGTGVAFKIVEALIHKGNEEKIFSVPEGWEKWLLDLVALATVADMVELSGENRTLVHYGLVVMKKGRRPGLRALMDKVRVPLAHVTEDDIAFSIAPKINAASRMKSPMLALELLSTDSVERAQELAKELVRLNDARKLEGARIAKEVKKRIDGTPLAPVVVLGNSTWKPALLGIAASNVVETYGRPVCLWGKEGDLLKGSCRSDGSINIVELLAASSELFEDFGGHEQSGGFSLVASSIHELPEKLEASYKHLKEDSQRPQETESDENLHLSEVSFGTYSALRRLAPYGMGNKKPVFTFANARIAGVHYFGKHKEHLRITISDENGSHTDVIGFFFQRAPCSDTLDLLSEGDTVSVVGSIECSYFGRKREVRLRLEDIQLTGN